MNKWLSFFVLLMAVCGTSNHVEAICSATKLTERATYDAPQITDEWLMWSGYEYDAQGLYNRRLRLYNLVTPGDLVFVEEQVTMDSMPQMSGGQVVWLHGEGIAREVYLYDIDSNRSTQITHDELYAADPVLHEGRLVWVSSAFGSLYEDGEIVLYDSTTGRITQITDNDEGDFSPQIYGERVVWLNAHEGTTRLMLYEAGETTVISDSTDPYAEPQLNARWLVWSSLSATSGRDLFVYDLNTQTQITLSEATYFIPPMLDDENMVWVVDDGDDNEILLYDGEDIQQITDNDVDDEMPFIAGDRIVWSGALDDLFSIYQYEISSATTTQIVDAGYNFAPHVNHNGNIAWLGDADVDGGNILLYRCDED